MAFSLVNGLSVIVPQDYAGILPVSPCQDPFSFEWEAFRGLSAAISSGDFVLDVGGSYGVMALLMAKLCGVGGEVWTFEPNESAISLGKVLAEANGELSKISFFNALVGERESADEDFWVVPGFGSVASSRSDEIRKFHQDATRKTLPMVSLDGLLLPRKPSVIKIDIEGGELNALLGASATLRETRPALVIETHGAAIWKQGGTVSSVVRILHQNSYKLWDLLGGAYVTPECYATRYHTTIGQLLAIPVTPDDRFDSVTERLLS